MCEQLGSLEFSDPSVSWERLERKSISPHSSSFFQFFQVSHFFKNKSLFTEATYRTQDNHVSAMLQRTSKSEMGWITCTWSYGLFQDFRLFFFSRSLCGLKPAFCGLMRTHFSWGVIRQPELDLTPKREHLLFWKS